MTTALRLSRTGESSDPGRPHCAGSGQLSLAVTLARSERYGIAELVGTVCYRYDPAITGRQSGHQPGDVLAPLFGYLSGHYNDYADLHVRALLDTRGDVSNGRAYGWACEYRPHTVELARSQTMTAFLRRTGRQLDALTRQLGSPGDFADYLTHVAVALGITHFAEHTADLRQDGTHWKWMDTDQMRAWIRSHERPTTSTGGQS